MDHVTQRMRNDSDHGTETETKMVTRLTDAEKNWSQCEASSISRAVF